MVKILGERNGRKMIGIGLSHGNLDRLKAGHPIHFSAEELRLATLHVHDVFIYAGETEDAMRKELEDAGVLGEAVVLEDARLEH